MPVKKSPSERWAELDTFLKRAVPQLASVLADEGEFRELRVKTRPDGTMLAILKVFGPDGGPLVCFGSGYGYAGCLMALDSTVSGNHWKVDPPWEPGVR